MKLNGGPRMGTIVLLVLCTPLAAAADTPGGRHALPSEFSELVYVYESLRVATQRGDVDAFCELYDPTTLREAFPDAGSAGGAHLSRGWLQAHAREWLSVDRWDVAEGRVSTPWARIVFRNAHRDGTEPDGRWDYYFMIFREVDGHWRLHRRAIATFGTPGVPEPAPQMDELVVIPAFMLPPGT